MLKRVLITAASVAAVFTLFDTSMYWLAALPLALVLACGWAASSLTEVAVLAASGGGASAALAVLPVLRGGEIDPVDGNALFVVGVLFVTAVVFGASTLAYLAKHVWQLGLSNRGHG